jgi:putative membrane protein
MAIRPASSAHRRLERALAASFAVVWALSAHGAHYPEDWLLENWLVVGAVATMALWRRLCLPAPATMVALWCFLVLHEIGAHYTYSLVPYDAWFQSVSGTTLSALTGWQRNHYDRLVHLMFGLLLVVPFRELVVRATGLEGRGGWVFATTLVVTGSVFYEFIEWGAAEYFGGDLGMAYLGTQGDVWDGHKDMALASAGAVACSLARWTRHRLRGHDPLLAWLRAERAA